MSFKKLNWISAVLLTASLSIWSVGCGKPAADAPATPAADAPAETPAEETPAADAEAGSSTGGAGAEVPEGGEEPAKKAE